MATRFSFSPGMDKRSATETTEVNGAMTVVRHRSESERTMRRNSMVSPKFVQYISFSDAVPGGSTSCCPRCSTRSMRCRER